MLPVMSSDFWALKGKSFLQQTRFLKRTPVFISFDFQIFPGTDGMKLHPPLASVFLFILFSQHLFLLLPAHAPNLSPALRHSPQLSPSTSLPSFFMKKQFITSACSSYTAQISIFISVTRWWVSPYVCVQQKAKSANTVRELKPIPCIKRSCLINNWYSRTVWRFLDLTQLHCSLWYSGTYEDGYFSGVIESMFESFTSLFVLCANAVPLLQIMSMDIVLALLPSRARRGSLASRWVRRGHGLPAEAPPDRPSARPSLLLAWRSLCLCPTLKVCAWLPLTS